MGVSRGIGIGPARLLPIETPPVKYLDLHLDQIEAEVRRLHDAVRTAIDELHAFTKVGKGNPERSVSSIFGVHLLLLQESSLVRRIEHTIRFKRVNAEWAIKLLTDEHIAQQSTNSDELFREKHLDVVDVMERVLVALSGNPGVGNIEIKGAVIIARHLKPSSIVEMLKGDPPAAIITERAGWTSHTSIIAREFNLPMVSGFRGGSQAICENDQVIVNGNKGEVIIRPTALTLMELASLPPETKYQAASRGSDIPTTTLDGTAVSIRANVDSTKAYAAAAEAGARGIGLYRSESLIIRGLIPSEEAQFEAFSEIAAAVGEAGMGIRTFDIGYEQARQSDDYTEINPALGLRSIRLSLTRPAYFRTQIRALLRVSALHKIDIILPMISGVDEIVRSKAIIDEERKRLEQTGMPYGNPNIGAMIEVPSAILIAEQIARHVDIMCLGTNDLVQYLLAVDRDNDSVSDWYQTLHPAVIRATKSVIDAGAAVGTPVVVCGEMAGSAFYVPLLLGLGTTGLSMNPNSVAAVRFLVSNISIADAATLVDAVISMETAEAIETHLRNYYLDHWAHLFPPGLLEKRHR
ncbi:MAG: phosphoenolpyruvate--protein phosphotransferase [Pyrinomonadaceae bacterium]